MSFIMSKKQNKTDKAFKAVLLDADGTLYDSTMLHFEAYRKACFELYTFDFTEEIYFTECVRKYKKPPQILQEQGIEYNAEEFYLKKRGANVESINNIEETTTIIFHKLSFFIFLPNIFIV